ncbi:MAG: ATP-dependent nuclease [Patescibacteria group bacterium UBA2163]
MIKKVSIKNYKSIKDSGDIIFSESMFVLAGQNESGKSSILEALNAYESEEFERDSLNFEEEQAENFTQEISCTYLVDDSDDLANSLIKKFRKTFSIGDEDDFFDKGKLKSVKEYTITKQFNLESNTLEMSLTDSVFGIVRGAIKNKEVVETNTDGKEVKNKTPWIDLEGKEKEVAEVFFGISPEIVLFNAFSDLLPDKIKISDLESRNTEAEGYNAVKNLEELLDKDFVSISKLSNSHQTSVTSTNVTKLSTKFQKAWKQRIYSEGDLYIKFQINNESVNSQAVPTVFFYIETKDNVLLEPRKRSKGMIWFLSAWLELKSMEHGRKRVILYDEPGLHLHVKAHKDILNVFDELIKKNHQVIYSTHSPSLINTELLYNIGLVINTKDNGTIVEGLTTTKLDTTYKQEALQPIAEAMGLEPLKDFSVLSRKNVLLEGLSDFWYFKSMAKILDKEIDYKFVPGIGIKGNHIYHLISFCIGYGLDWLLVMDNGENPKMTKEDLKERIFNGDDNETNKKIKLISKSEIENLFTVKDFSLVDKKIKTDDKRKPSTIIGRRKILFAREFASKVEREEIKKENLSNEAVQSFEVIFKWIDDNLSTTT